MAPTLYGWVRLSSAMWPQTSLRVGIVKVRRSAALADAIDIPLSFHFRHLPSRSPTGHSLA